VAVIGAGRVGTTVALLLQRSGHPVIAATGRERSRERVRRFLPSTQFVRLADAATATRNAELVLLSVPDDAVETLCADLAANGGVHSDQAVLHLSGALGLDVLRTAEDRGATVLSLHPLQSIPDVEEGLARLPGSAVAVTARTDQAFALGESLARDIGGIPFRLGEEAKPLYHAAAVFCSNYLVVVESIAEQLFRSAGLTDPVERFAPLARTALDLALTRGPATALTGPAARGDAGTVALHLRALADRAPDAVQPYVALARSAAALAVQNGSLSEEGWRGVEEVLTQWR
jgi:predicted short-subunit dehydrogenase-like oxidoreductase (DUF2520 family)